MSFYNMKSWFNGTNLAVLLAVLILLGSVYGEFLFKKSMYFTEKKYDLQLQYKDKVYSNKRVVEALFDELLTDKEIRALMAESSNSINKVDNRKKLFSMLESKYTRMKKKGILQFHFHLADGESFLRFHKPRKFGDSLLFRKSIQKVIETKKPVYGFEVGRFFDGFRYVYPIFYDHKYVGSVETSISARSVMKQMKESLDARYSMVLKGELVDNVIAVDHIKKHYHKFCVDKSYYMANAVHKEKSLARSALRKIKPFVNQQIKTDLPFAKDSKDSAGNLKLFVFIPMLDVEEKNVGYIFSVRDDEIVNKIFKSQLIKFVVGVILILLIGYFYRLNKAKTNMIAQLQNAIDRTTLLSKTDKKGKITYVNDAFVQVSGYSKEELLGKAHNIVRDPDVPKDVFKDLWETISSKSVWKGTIPNRAKDGTTYVVDVTIIPLLDINGEIKEFVAIRHDVTELEKYKDILKEQLDDTSKSLQENISYTEQYEEALNSTVAVLKTDNKGVITYINNNFAKVSGYSQEELLGTSCKEFRHQNHKKAKDCQNIFEKM